MYGKHFSSMYTGSMVGSGALTFAMMGYVIANMRPDKTVGFQVELNPKIIATVFGESEDAVKTTIEKLCSPDPESRTKEEGGRRIIKVGQFDYRVVNGSKYSAIRNEHERRAYNREAKRRQRARENGGVKASEQNQDEVTKLYPHDAKDQRTIRDDLRNQTS